MGKWDWVPLGSVIKIDKNSVLPTDFAQDVYYVGLEDIEKETGRILSTIKIASDVGLKSNKFEFTDQHILYGKLRPNLNKVALPDFNGVCSTDIYPILPITSRIDKRFLCAVLRSTLFVDYVSNKVNGVNLPRVNEKIISDFRIPLPPIPIQQKIADALDKASALIEMRKAQIEKLDLLVKSQFIEMFGDPVTNPKGWALCSMGDVFKIISGGTPKTDIREFWDFGEISWIGSSMCQNRTIYANDGKYISRLGLEQSSAKIIKQGAVLVALVGATIGKTAMLRFETATNQNIAAILVNESKAYKSEFVFWYVQLIYNKFLEIGDEKFKMASLGFVKQLKIFETPYELQLKFWRVAQDAEEQRVVFQESIKGLELNYKSLMQKCFSGEMFSLEERYENRH